VKKFLVILLLGCVALADWNGNRYTDSKYPVTFEIPSSWKILLDGQHRATAMRGDEITVMDFNIQPANKRSAEEVARDRLRAYDSWRYLAGAQLNGNERKGAESAFNVMYNRSVFQRSTAHTALVIVQEGYFVKGDMAYIFTITTDSTAWNDAKRDILQIWNSFKVN
jgi:hypothetical protein